MNKIIAILMTLVLMTTAVITPTKANAFTDSEMQTVTQLANELRTAKEENRKLKEQLEMTMAQYESLVHLTATINYILDANRDCVVDAGDASFILTYYALTSTGKKFSSYSELHSTLTGRSEGQILPN